MRLLKLEADNFQRLRVARVTPEGAMTVIGGRNAQGKSSLLDAVEALLGGKKHTSKMPVRRGQPRAKVVLELGDDPELQDLTVTRTFTPDGGGTIVIEGKDGSRYPSPQDMLHKLIGRDALAFDPCAFERLKDDEQAETLRALVGLDTSDLDAEHERTYNLRTERNRIVKQLEGQLSGLDPHPGVPSEEVSIAALSERLAAANESVKAYEAGKRRYIDASTDVQTNEQRVASLKKQLADAEADLVAHQQELEAARQDGIRLKAALVDPAPILDAMKNAESVNAKVRQNAARAKVETQLEQEREAAKTLTDKLDALDTQKAERIASVSFPVPGLSIVGTEVMFHDVPFSQASQAERLRVAAAIGFALCPRLKVLLVRDGSRLDSDGIRMLEEVAEAVDGHVLLERVAEPDKKGHYPSGLTLVIEDGAVLEQAATA